MEHTVMKILASDNGYRATCIRNAIALISSERRTARRIDEVHRRLSRMSISAGWAEDFLSSPFIQTALSILKSFSGNYKIQQALKLLNEAGAEEVASKKKKKGKK